MLKQDWCGKYRFYVRGAGQNLIDFTVDLAWYHSALAHIASVNEMDDGETVLNLVVQPENYGSNGNDICERALRRLVAKHSLVGFSTWDEYNKEEREGA